MNYCSPGDLYLFGLTPGAVPNPGRNVAAATLATNSIDLDGHGYDLDGEVEFRLDLVSGSLPAPLVAGTVYYAQPIDERRFRVSATPGGDAIVLTTAGSRFVAISDLPIDAAIAWASRIIDDSLPAHAVPMVEPIPEIVRMSAAELAAWKLMTRAGAASKSLGEMIDDTQKRLARWAKGVPLRGPDLPAHTNLAASAATARCVDVSGWRRFGGL